MSDTVLYEVFFDRSTQLGAMLVSRYDRAEAIGDLDAAGAWRSRHFAVRDEREAVDALDRNAQINQIFAWQHELETLACTPPDDRERGC